jgi:hypothetical protein
MGMPSRLRTLLLCVLLSGCTAAAITETPMTPACRELPAVEECQYFAGYITDECLRQCVYSQCSQARVLCSGYIQQKCRDDARHGGDVGGFVFRGEQSCTNPREEIYWCERPMSRRCRTRTMVHELAHSCGWRHGDGQNVPERQGGLICRD